jgi:UDP-glucose 4-epimerase
VYGLREGGVMREADPVLLDACLAADGGAPGYACGKATMEAIGREASERHGQRVLIVRPFNVVGRRQMDAHGMVLPSFVAEARRGTAIRIFDDGQQTRAFSAVETFVSVLCQLVWEPRAWTDVPNIVNLGSPRSTSIEALARLVIAELGTRTVLEHVPYGDLFPGRLDVRHRVPDPTRLESYVGPVEWPLIRTIVRRFCSTTRRMSELDQISATHADVIRMPNVAAVPSRAEAFE